MDKKTFNQLLEDHKRGSPQPKRKQKNEEDRLQMWLVRWIDGLELDIKYCATAGGLNTSVKARSKFKKMGYKKGFPDIVFYEPRGGYHGLAVEVKVKGGSASQDQKDWKRDLELRGYKAIIMPTNLEFWPAFDWVKDKICKYLGIPNADK